MKINVSLNSMNNIEVKFESENTEIVSISILTKKEAYELREKLREQLDILSTKQLI